MSHAPAFRLVPISSLRPHEQIDPGDVRRLAAEIRTLGIVREPIWVTEGDGVILNGHHRYAALRAIGVRRVPAWVVDYSDPAMELGRWDSGPPLRKEDVLGRARAGELFPPKTSRHVWHGPAPSPHPTPLIELQADDPGAGSPSGPQERVRSTGRR